jgi:hypothetical protein
VRVFPHVQRKTPIFIASTHYWENAEAVEAGTYILLAHTTAATPKVKARILEKIGAGRAGILGLNNNLFYFLNI